MNRCIPIKLKGWSNIFLDFISHYFEANFKLSLLCFLFAWTFCLCYLLRFLQLCGQIKKSLKSWNFNVHKVTLLQNTLTLQLMRYVVADVQLDTILERCLCQRFDHSSLPTRVLIDNPIHTTLDTKPGRTVKKGLRNLLFWIINVGTSERNGNVKTNSTKVQEGVRNLTHGIHVLIFFLPRNI